MNVRPSLNRALLFGAATLIAAACGRDPQLPTDTEPTTAEVQPAAGDVATALVVHRRHTPDLMKIEGVVGTGLGVDGEKPRIRVYTVHGNVRGIPDHVDNVPIERVVTGLILAGDINNPASRERPAPNGFSIGHPDITAGTMGAIVRDTDDVCYALSNNHVLANSNDASIGDNALQPGPADGGSDPTDAIGTLADFEPISFSSDNEMDAAIAELFDPASVTGSTPDYAYGAPGTSTVNPSVGLDVQKFGRTTAHTTGDVAEIDVTVSVCYVTRGPFNCASAATFVDQFTITPGSFSDGGDSGSLIVTDNDDAANPVGLLFAGSDTRTIANPIGPVLGRFGVVIEPNTANCGGDGGDPPANQPPTADFAFSADGLAVDFTDESSDSDGSVVSWSWDFGDGNDSADQNPSHTYDADGDYTVTLTVTDDDGATDDVSQTVTVDDDSDPPANEAPTADFSFSADGLTVDFTDESSDSDGSVVAWSWDFGDGGDSAAENPSHTYDDGGTYTVTLTVTDDDGAEDQTSQQVSVTAPDPGGISLSATGYKVRGVHHADLSWSGATSTNVDIVRNGNVVDTTANTGTYTDNTGNRGGGSYTYQVCEAGTETCSSEVSVTP